MQQNHLSLFSPGFPYCQTLVPTFPTVQLKCIKTSQKMLHATFSHMQHDSFNVTIPSLLSPHLKQPGDEDREANGLHDVGVVLQQGLAAAFHPQVQHLGLVLVVEVSRVVGDLALNAGPGREGVAAAEGDAVHQVLPLNITS